MSELRQQAQQDTGRALEAVQKARRELDHVEEQLVLAAAGRPYLRVGRYEGLDVGKVFEAFTRLEDAATEDRREGGDKWQIEEEMLEARNREAWKREFREEKGS
jgi:hypothetical protein